MFLRRSVPRLFLAFVFQGCVLVEESRFLKILVVHFNVVVALRYCVSRTSGKFFASFFLIDAILLSSDDAMA